MKAAVIVGCLAVVLVVASTRQPLADSLFPLPDGRYVSDPAYCQASDAEIGNLAEEAGGIIRTIENDTINYHYPGRCRIVSGDTVDGAFVFTERCSAEGETFANTKMWEVESPAAFNDRGTVFRWCEGSGNQTASNVQGGAEHFGADAVYSAQIALQRLGFDPGPADGQMGPRTRRAMNAFQRQNGLPVTRDLNAATYRPLIQAEQALFDRQTPEEANEQDAAAVEPAGGSNETASEDKSGITSGQISNSTLNVIAELPDEISNAQFERARALREKMIENPEEFSRKFGSGLYPEFATVLSKEEAVERLLKPTFVHVTCAMQDVSIIGYYNVYQHIWVLAWVSQTGEILKGTLSLGFEPITEPENTAWFQLAGENEPHLDAIDKALDIQTKTFALLFWSSDCNIEEDFGNAFTPHAAIATLWYNESEIRKIEQDAQNDISLITKHSLEIEQSEIISLVYIARIGDPELRNYITLHIVDRKPETTIIQTWNIDGQDVQLLEQDWKLIGIEEQE